MKEKVENMIKSKEYNYFSINRNLPEDTVLTFVFGPGIVFRGTKKEVEDALVAANLYVNSESYKEKGIYTCRTLNANLYHALKHLYKGSVNLDGMYQLSEDKKAAKAAAKAAKAKEREEAKIAKAKAKEEAKIAKAKAKEEAKIAKAKAKQLKIEQKDTDMADLQAAE